VVEVRQVAAANCDTETVNKKRKVSEEQLPLLGKPEWTVGDTPKRNDA
jgi:hypothetical protein